LNEAEESFKGALVYQQRLFGDTAPKAMTLLALSDVYADQGFFQDSLRAYDVGVKILMTDDIARSRVTFDQVAPLVTSASAIAESTPARRNEMEAKIFQGLQLLSGGVTDQTIQNASVRLAAKTPAMQETVRGLQEAERLRDAARLALAVETSLPDEQRGAAKEAALLAEFNLQANLHEQFLAKLTSEFPAYVQLTHPKPVELAEMQSQLRPKEAMVLFEIGRSKSFVVLVTKDRLVAKPLALDQAKVETTVRALRKAFTAKNGRLPDFDLAASHSLYRALFGPIENQLEGIDQLVLVQSGALSSLPTALLVTAAPPADSDYRRTAWFARRYASFEVPSIGAFATLRQRGGATQTVSRPFFGIGNPEFVGEAAESAKEKGGLAAMGSLCRDDGPFPAQMLRALAPLPDTATELQTVAKALGAGPGSMLLGANATEANLRAQSLQDVRVIYFATHALLPGELSCQSEPALALSPPATPATSRDQDGLLDASEVAGLQLNADLVVLSACNTGQTESKFGGQALSGLAEAFFYAGARSLVASHWQVPSGATAKLMVGMFEKLTAEPMNGSARALRVSQMALMDRPDSAHPFFWAAFTIIGNDSAPQSLAVSALSGQAS
jgi:CHAT domain-containing protein